jgi:hypothetical protein
MGLGSRSDVVILLGHEKEKETSIWRN